MNLENHAGAEFLTAKLGVDSNHGDLDDIGSGSLDRRIDGGALGHAAAHAVTGVDFGMLTDPAKQRARHAGIASLAQTILDVTLYALVPLEVPRDELRRLLRADSELLRQSEGRLPVNDPKVHGLGALPLGGCDGFNRQPQHGCRGSGMDAFPGRERFRQTLITG